MEINRSRKLAHIVPVSRRARSLLYVALAFQAFAKDQVHLEEIKQDFRLNFAKNFNIVALLLLLLLVEDYIAETFTFDGPSWHFLLVCSHVAHLVEVFEAFRAL